jgi:hypothetical protein
MYTVKRTNARFSLAYVDNEHPSTKQTTTDMFILKLYIADLQLNSPVSKVER